MINFLYLFYSAIVSNVNCVATVLWEDFVSSAPRFKKLSDSKQVWALKILSKLLHSLNNYMLLSDKNGERYCFKMIIMYGRVS